MTAFGPLSTAFHDASEPRAGDAEVEWYAQRLPREAGPVLEAMCGSGRVLVPLAQRGFHVHGADASAAMLALCESRLVAAGLRPTLFRQDVAALNLPFRYGAVFVAGSSFQLFAEPHLARQALERIRAHLVPPALLLLDLTIPDVGLHPPAAPLVEIRAARLGDGARITLRSETLVDTHAQRVDMKLRYELRAPARELEREDDAVVRTWYDEAQIEALLASAGFVDIAIVPPARARDDGRAFAASARASA